MLGSPGFIKPKLESVSYYRLSGYWHPFRDLPGDNFKPNTQFQQVWDQYVFDRRLRLLVMDAIERFEIAIRGLVAFEHSKVYGPFGYATDSASLPTLVGGPRLTFFDNLSKELCRSQETFVDHYKQKYFSEPYFPIWMATEVMSFGLVSRLFRDSPKPIRNAVAIKFGVNEDVLGSWCLTLNTVRNICAHHGRFWNRPLKPTPKLPRRHSSPKWDSPVQIPRGTAFTVLTICKHCLDVLSPGHKWGDRVKTLIANSTTIPIARMGFPPNWQQSKIWI